MIDPSVMHREAMSIADEAAAARRIGDVANFVALTRAALNREVEAASHFLDRHDLEPTRSILYRSAATLAVDLSDYKTAEKLIAIALSGEPPDSIAHELRDLLETVYFQRHLDLRGVRLQADEFQFSIEGVGIGFGIAPAEQFVGRVRDMETLIYRTAERKLNRPFREAGRRQKRLDESLQLYMTVPRAASFAVTFRIGASDQSQLPGTSLSEEVVQEVLTCFELLNHGGIAELEGRIASEPYFNNFLGLAQKLAPDGDVVRSVGFTAAIGTAERRVALTTPRRDIKLPRKALLAPPGESTFVELTGTLLEADAKKSDTGQIEVRSASGALFKILVPRGMMRDIVRPLFEEEVVVTGIKVGSEIRLETIRISE